MPSLRSLVILMLLLAVGLGVIRLISAPLDIAWLGRSVAARLADRLGDEWDVSVAAIRFDFTQGIMPTVSALDVSLESAALGLVVDLPQISGKPAFAALYTGELNLGELHLDRPFVGVAQGKAGQRLFSGAEFAQMADSGVRKAVSSLVALGVDDVIVSAATLVMDGEVPRAFETIDLTASVDKQAETLAVHASLDGREGRWNVQFRHGTDSEKDDEHWLQLSAADVTIADFMPVGSAVRSGRGLGLPMFPQLTLRLTADGVFSRGDLRLGVGGGYLSLQGDDTVSIDEVLLHLSWSAGQQHVVLEPSYAVLGDSRIALHGEIKPPREAGSASWEFAIEAPKARLRPRDVPGAPLVLDRALVFGSFDAAKMLLNLDTISVRAGTVSVTGAGNVEFGPDGPLMALAMSFGSMPVATVKRLWPSMVSPKARSWFLEHIEAGRVHGGRLVVALDPLGFDGDPATVGWTEDGVRLDFTFDDVAVKGVGALPKLEGVGGSGTISGGRLVVEATGARAMAPGGGEISVDEGRFEIPDLRVVEKSGKLDLSLQGAAADIARVAALPPIDATRQIGIVPGALSGTGDVEASVSFPLERHFDRDTAAWTLSAKLSDFSSSEPISGQTIDKAKLQITADPASASVRGTGVLNGLKADIDLVQSLDGSGPGAGQGVTLNIDTRDLASKGIDLGDLVDGKIRIVVNTRDDGRRDVVADLRDAELKIAPVGWSKGKGVAATARFLLSENRSGQIVDDFLLTSDGVRIAGNVKLDKAGALQSARFDEFALRDKDSGSLTITRTKNGGYSVVFNADRFDGRGLLASLKRGNPNDGIGSALEFRATVGRLTGFNGVEVTSLAATVSSSGGAIRSAEISGLSNGRASVRALIKPDGDRRDLEVQMANTGAVFAFLDVYKRMKGGAGTLTGRLGKDGEASGRLVVSNLTISDDPGLKQILASSPALVTRNTDRDRDAGRLRRLAQSGTSFQKLNIEFSKFDDRIVVREGTLKGPVLGGTVEGTIDLGPQQVNLTGTFVPAYALNNLFGQIPLLGQLVGGRTGGLLGVTFRVSGTLDNPVLSVNPMSAIAPGIFRKIFEFR